MFYFKMRFGLSLFPYLWMASILSAEFASDLRNPDKLMATYNERFMQHIEAKTTATDPRTRILYMYHEMRLRREIYHTVKKYDWAKFEDQFIKKQFELYHQIGPLIMSDNVNLQFREIIFQAEKHYKETNNLFKARLIKYTSADDRRNSVSRSDVLQRYWKLLSQKLASQIKPLIERYFTLIRNTATSVGFYNAEEFWMFVKGLKITSYDEELENLWNENIEKPHHQIISYMQKEFSIELGLPSVKENEPIRPYLYNIISNHRSYTDILNFQVLDKVISDLLESEKDYTLRKLVREAEKYFVSLNFPSLNNYFWENSSFVLIASGTPIFEISFHNPQYYRVNIMAPINYETYHSILQLLFRISKYLFIEGKKLPVIFRESNFKPFDDALEAAVILPALSPATIKAVFIDRIEITDSLIMDTLKVEAVKVFTTLSSALVMDSWKWTILNSNMTQNLLDCLWFSKKMVEKVQPISKGEHAVDLDSLVDCSSPTKFFPDEVTYQDFITLVLKYQIFASLCKNVEPDNSGWFEGQEPLHKCFISWNIDITQRLSEVLSLGSSKDWKELLGMITGNRNMNAGPILRYFAPVFKLIEQAKQQKHNAGWKSIFNFILKIKD